MTAGVYFAGADATLTIDTVAVAAIHGWSFTISKDVNDLYGSGSIFKIASAQYNVKVEVKIKYAKFDPASSYIANTIKGDVEGLSDPVYKGSICDTTKVKRFSVVGTVDAFDEDDGTVGTDLSVTVANVYLEGVPFQMSELDWVAVDMTGIGQSVTIAENAG
jgi:hypothetical protein